MLVLACIIGIKSPHYISNTVGDFLTTAEQFYLIYCLARLRVDCA